MTPLTIDPQTFSSNPGHFQVSQNRLQKHYPELFSTLSWLKFIFSVPEFPFTRREFWKTHIQEHLQEGDSRAALVISKTPLLVAAYSDDIDSVLVLQFPNSFVDEYKLEVGTRLISVNTYTALEDTGGYEADVVPGPQANHRWGNFFPYIADFLTDEKHKLTARKTNIQESEWERTYYLAGIFLQRFQPRKGHPLICGRPAASLQ